jgi:predicted alpha/beta hydrolase
VTIKQTLDAIKQDLHGCNLHWLSHDELRVIEQYMIVAVEDEREACAKIAEIELAAQRELLQESKQQSKELSHVGHSFGAQAASDIARKIRARCEAKK